MSDYPEHDKLRAISDQSQVVGEFLDWLAEQGIHRMRWATATDHRLCIRCDGDGCTLCGETGYREIEVEGWVVDGRSTETLLAAFFGIDQDTIEREKRVMLDRVREANR